MGVRWVYAQVCACGQSVAKVCVCVYGLSVCRGQVGGVVKWVGGQVGGGQVGGESSGCVAQVCVCGLSVCVWPYCVQRSSGLMVKWVGGPVVGGQVGVWPKCVDGQSVWPKCVYVCVV